MLTDQILERPVSHGPLDQPVGGRNEDHPRGDWATNLVAYCGQNGPMVLDPKLATCLTCRKRARLAGIDIPEPVEAKTLWERLESTEIPE